MCGVVSQTANAGLASQWYRAALKGVLASLEWAACAKWWGASVLAGQSAEAGARGRVCRAESAGPSLHRATDKQGRMAAVNSAIVRCALQPRFLLHRCTREIHEGECAVQ